MQLSSSSSSASTSLTWEERFAPQTSADLAAAVFSGKASATRAWLEQAGAYYEAFRDASRRGCVNKEHIESGVGSPPFRPRLLILSGVFGCGKSSTVKVLCKELGIEVQSISADWRDADMKYNPGTSAGPGSYVNQRDEFEYRVASAKFPVLALSNSSNTKNNNFVDTKVSKPSKPILPINPRFLNKDLWPDEKSCSVAFSDRASKSNNSSVSNKKILLLEDPPEVLCGLLGLASHKYGQHNSGSSAGTNQVNDMLAFYKAVLLDSGCPLVIVFSSSNTGSGDNTGTIYSCKVPREIQDCVDIDVIYFPPITTLKINKVLTAILSKLSIPVLKGDSTLTRQPPGGIPVAVLDHINSCAGGDLRQAITSLQFFCATKGMLHMNIKKSSGGYSDHDSKLGISNTTKIVSNKSRKGEDKHTTSKTSTDFGLSKRKSIILSDDEAEDEEKIKNKSKQSNLSNIIDIIDSDDIEDENDDIIPSNTSVALKRSKFNDIKEINETPTPSVSHVIDLIASSALSCKDEYMTLSHCVNKLLSAKLNFAGFLPFDCDLVGEASGLPLIDLLQYLEFNSIDSIVRVNSVTDRSLGDLEQIEDALDQFSLLDVLHQCQFDPSSHLDRSSRTFDDLNIGSGRDGGNGVDSYRFPNNIVAACAARTLASARGLGSLEAFENKQSRYQMPPCYRPKHMQLFSHTRNRAEVIRNEMTEAYAESIILNNAYSDKICGTNHSLVLHSCNNVLRELITTCLPFISIISIGFSSILIGSNIQSDVIGCLSNALYAIYSDDNRTGGRAKKRHRSVDWTCAVLDEIIEEDLD